MWGVPWIYSLCLAWVIVHFFKSSNRFFLSTNRVPGTVADPEETEVSMEKSSRSNIQLSEWCCYCSVTKSCLTLCDPMDCSTPGLPVHHHLLEFSQTHVHGVGDAIQPSHPLSSPSPPAFSLSQHQGLFQWVSSLHQVTKVLELFSISPSHEYSGLISLRVDWLDLLAEWVIEALTKQTSTWFHITWMRILWRRIKQSGGCRDQCGGLSRKASRAHLEKSVRESLSDKVALGKGSERSEGERVGNRFSSVQFSRSVVSDSLQPHESQHTRPPCPSPTPGVYPNPCPLSGWCHPTILSSVVPLSSCPQSFPASGFFQMSQLFAWGGQSTGVSASTSVLPMNTQDWSSLGWTGWIFCSPRDSQKSSPIPQLKSINSSALSFLYSPTLTSIHDHWDRAIQAWRMGVQSPCGGNKLRQAKNTQETSVSGPEWVRENCRRCRLRGSQSSLHAWGIWLPGGTMSQLGFKF